MWMSMGIEDEPEEDEDEQEVVGGNKAEVLG